MHRQANRESNRIKERHRNIVLKTDRQTAYDYIGLGDPSNKASDLDRSLLFPVMWMYT